MTDTRNEAKRRTAKPSVGDSTKIRMVRPGGSDVNLYFIEGNPKRPEPQEHRLVFPGGAVSVVRTTDNRYWVHVRVVDAEEAIAEERPQGFLVDARIDINGEASASTHKRMKAAENPLLDPRLYHLAVLIDTQKGG